jgi:hypothetical protein
MTIQETEAGQLQIPDLIPTPAIQGDSVSKKRGEGKREGVEM